MADIERELGWDDNVENDSPDFILLAEGDYDFEVTGFERARHPGSEKLPPCNKAIVTITIESEQGTVNIKYNLFLHTKCEGLLCAFFTGIGHRKHGERLRMKDSWPRLIGSKGRCKVKPREWKNDKGEIVYLNEIKKIYEPEENTQQTWNAGKF